MNTSAAELALLAFSGLGSWGAVAYMLAGVIREFKASGTLANEVLRNFQAELRPLFRTFLVIGPGFGGLHHAAMGEVGNAVISGFMLVGCWNWAKNDDDDDDDRWQRRGRRLRDAARRPVARVVPQH